MLIGLSVYNINAVDLIDLAVAADEMGFDSIWLGEYIILPVGYGREDGPAGITRSERYRTKSVVDPGTNLLDPMVALAACASRTHRIDLATGILLLPLRPPAVSARMVHSLVQISGGRVVLGIGSGWLQKEFDAVGVAFGDRGRRSAETIQILRTVWGGGPFSSHGEFFDLDQVQLCSDPVEVPIIMGGNSDVALRRAARLGDGWFASGTPDYSEA